MVRAIFDRLSAKISEFRYSEKLQRDWKSIKEKKVKNICPFKI